MNWEQLESLKRQAEEDFLLDTQAIERLQRRFNGNASSSTTLAKTGPASSVLESRSTEQPIIEPRHDSEPDDLTGTLRAMFTGASRR